MNRIVVPAAEVNSPEYFSRILTVRDVHLGDFHIGVDTKGTLFCDIDGTVADLTHRRVFVESKPKNWPAFEKTMHLDKPIQPIIDAVRVLYDAGWTVVMCTGRGAQKREVTETWLCDKGVPYHAFYSRAFKDYRRDDIIKAELLAQARADGYDPDLVFDDRNQVVEMWRANGIPCIQVAHGDF